jgi:predicted acyltransferase
MKRISSIDRLRGLDVLLMLFVNAVPEVPGTPRLLRHAAETVDGMTVADVVFPAFLFIVGMAIPMALGSRLARGESRPRVFRHVLGRTVALLVLGLTEVNGEEGAQAGADLGRMFLWYLLATIAALLVWGIGASSARRLRIRRGAGIAALIACAFLYRNPHVGGLLQLRTYWWGILGLIGWAYLVASGVYLLARDRRAVVVGAIALLYCLYLADEAGALGAFFPLEPYLPLGRVLASQSALVLSGALLTLMLLSRQAAPPEGIFAPALGYAMALACGGLLLHALHGLHTAFWINKLKATPAWCLLSAAFTIVAWALVHYVTDVKGWQRWPKVVTLAGENALLVYVLQPFFLAVFGLSLTLARAASPSGIVSSFGFAALLALLVAWLSVRFTGWLRGRGVQMRI